MEAYNPFSLKGKKILVTGASSGIGRAIALECSRLGAEVVVTGRDSDRLKETFEQLATEGKMVCADLSRADGIRLLAEETGELNGVVHCAGILPRFPFKFASRDKIEQVMNVNFMAPAEITQKLIKARKILAHGSIVFVSSVSGVYCSSMGGSIYSSSKGAVNGLVKGLALEFATRGIRVNSVNPGMIMTNLLNEGSLTDEQYEEDAKKYPLGRYGQPEEVAYAVIYLLSDASSWVTGSNLLIDGGFTLQ